MSYRYLIGGVLLAGAAVLVLSGCGSKPAAPPPASAQPHDADDHAHAKGVVAVGDYHARLIVEQGGVLKLFILGKDETQVATIDVQQVQGQLQAEGETEAMAVTLRADPQPGDSAGKTSQFIGEVPEGARGKPLVVTLLLMIDSDRYRPQFTSVASAGHDAHAGQPRGMPRGSEKERELYLTPGGIYTVADIGANGRTVPSEKFKGISWPHEDDLKPGDRICPITSNKADPRCGWIVAGKEYNFCCPPCLDKFVGWAKNKPEKVKDPAEYIEK
jgi:hypothetical protein